MKPRTSHLPHLLPWIASLVLLAIWIATPAQAQVFTENFNAAVGSNTNATAVGWVSYMANSTQASTVTNVSNYTNTQFNATSPKLNYTMMTTGGFMATVNNAGAANTAAASFKYSSGIDLSNGGSITWTMGNTGSNATVHLLLQIGGTGTANSGQWLVSTAGLANRVGYYCADSAAFVNVLNSGDLTNYTYSLDISQIASTWTTFTAFNPDANQMSLESSALSGAPVDLSNVTAIGFYTTWSSTNFNSVRIDNIVVVPEPTIAALLLLPALCFGLASRRLHRRVS